MKASFKAAHSAEFERHKVEKQGAVGFRRQRNQFAFGLRRGRIVNVLQTRPRKPEIFFANQGK